MTSLRIDRILLGLGALLILFSSYQLFFRTAESGSGPTLGTLTSTLSVVKTKNALALDWRDALAGIDVSENQLIYTDNRSSAEVVFTEGGLLEIGENSLVKLKTANLGQAMDLEKGFIRAKLEGDRPVKVQMNGEDYLVSGDGADIQINLQDRKGEIGVLQGEVKVQSANGTESLNPSSALSIDGDKLSRKTIYYKVASPLKSEIKYILASEGALTFRWSPTEEASVLISQNPSLENASKYSGVGETEVTLPVGLHYFRIEGEKGSSLLSSVRLIQETAPVLLRPLTGQKVSLMEGGDPQILLQWKDDGKNSYLLEWNDGEDHSQTVKGSSALAHVKGAGAFKWRLKILNNSRPDAIWTDWQEVQVNFIAMPAVPTNLTPHDIEFQTYDTPNEKVELKWKNDLISELEIVDPKGSTLSQKTSNNNFEYLATLGGAYRWRVRSVDNYLRQSEWSEWKDFVIEDLSSTKSGEGIQRIQLKKPDQTVTFTWNAGSGTMSVFELARDAQFQKIIRRMDTKKDSAKVSIPETGAFYWRSRQYLPDGTMNVSEPKRVIIEPTPAPEKPNKLPDTEVPLEDFPVKKTTMLEEVMNFLIPSAYAEEEEIQGQVKIILPTEEDAKGYVVRIYKDEALTKLAFEMELDTKEFIWRFAKPGTYYWQYALIDYWDRRSPFSDPATLTIKGELVPRPERPLLISPIREAEIKPEDLKLKWTTSEKNIGYLVQVSEDEEFNNILATEEVTTHELDLSHLNLSPKNYFWRVTAHNKKLKEIKSSTGRFVIQAPLEKTLIIDRVPWRKEWKKRIFLGWSPSMDSYTFKDEGEMGKIDGNALMGVTLAGTYFRERGAFNVELLRQAGKVFEKEEYLFQRLSADYIYTWNYGTNHRIGVGLSVGQTSAQSYEIIDGAVKAKAESGLSYGVVARNYLSFSREWEMQGKLQYLTGDISQLDAEALALRHQKNFFWVGGAGFSSRSYSTSSGSQSSIKLTLGIGKEF